VQYLIGLQAKWVVDVDSSIIDEINQNPSIGYLIKFHAPWFVSVIKFKSNSIFIQVWTLSEIRACLRRNRQRSPTG
jgi:hypothetical protein